MSNGIEDVTRRTKIVGCNKAYYDSQSPATDPNYEYTIYLVNTGISISDDQQAYTDFYYGARKLTDIFFVDEYPSQDYPDDKFYIQAVSTNVSSDASDPSTTEIKGYQIYFKHDDVIFPVETSMVASAVYDDSSSLVTPVVSINWRTSDGTVTAATKLLVANDSGFLPDSVVTLLINNAIDYMSDHDYFVKWEEI